MTDRQLQGKLKNKILERVDLSRELSDEEILELIDETLLEFAKTCYLSLKDRHQLRQELFNSMRKLDILQELLDDSSITEIMINGTEGIFIEQNGRLQRWDKRFTSLETLENLIQQMAGVSNRMVTERNPIVDTRLENGARVNVVLSPVALNGPIITIRRFPERPIRMQELLDWGTLTEEAALFLRKAVEAKYNIFVSGGTGSGKTTFLNVLSGFIPEDERVIVIEDNAELQIQNIPNLVRMEVRNANTESCEEIGIRQLVKTALRMRPDRLIVGEIRGEEALDVLQAFHTGHDGSLSTGHANTPKDMLGRLEMMVLMGVDMPLAAIQRQIASGIDLIVHLGRLRDGTRKVLEIMEIEGCTLEGVICHTLYHFEETGEDERGYVTGMLRRVRELMHQQKLERAGISGQEIYGL